MTNNTPSTQNNTTNAPKPEKKTPKIRKRQPFLIRLFKFFFRWVVGLILLVLIVVGGAGYYFLGTNLGAKHLVDIANSFSGYQISADDIEGYLFDELTLTNAKVNGPDAKMTVKKAVLNWSPKQIFNQKIILNQLRVEDADIVVSPSNDDKEDKPSEPPTLQDVRLPVGIIIKDISLASIRVIPSEPDPTSGEIIQESIEEKGKVDDEEVKEAAKNAGKKAAKEVLATADAPNAPHEKQKSLPVFLIDEASLSARYIDGVWEIDRLTFSNPDVTADISAKGKTLGDYPISLTTNTLLRSAEIGEVKINSNLDGDIGKTLQLNTAMNGSADADLSLTLRNILTKSPNMALALDIKRVDFADLGKRNDTSIPLSELSGKIKAEGRLSDLTANVDLHTTHVDFGKIQAVADVSGNPVENLNATLSTKGFLDAKLVANVSDFIAPEGQTTNPTFDATLDVTHVSEKLLQTDEATDLSGTITAKGKIEDLIATLDVKAKSKQIGKVEAKSNVTFDGKAITVRDLRLALPETKQAITGQADVNLATQDISASLKSNRFTWPQNAPELTAKKLDVQVNGTLDNYTATVLGELDVKEVPPFAVNGKIKGNLDKLTDSDITVNVLGGTVKSRGKVAWSPSLNVDTKINLANIQPHTFFPDVKGKLNGDVSVKVTDNDGKLAILADLSTLNGTLRGQPVNGKGKVKVNGDIVDIDALDVTLAGNRVIANGQVSADKLDLTYDVNATSLQKILPELKGAIVGKGTLKGSPDKPSVNATLSAENVAYQNYRVGKADIKADVDIASNKLNINAKTSDLLLDKEKIQSANLNINGKFSQHDLVAEVISEARTATVKGNGGLNLDKQSWSGTVSQIKFDEKSLKQLGQWQTENAFKLSASPENLTVSQLCLVQPVAQSAKVCVDGGLKEQFKNGQFDVTLANVKSSLFKEFMPKEVKLDNTISGKANIQLKNGNPIITGNITQNKQGKLTLATGNSPFTDTIRQLNLDFAMKNNAVSVQTDLDLKKLGKANIDAGLPNVNEGNFSARLKLDMPSLKPVENFVRDLANLKGSIKGDIAVKGTSSGQTVFTGDLKLNKTDFDVPAYGTQIRDLQLTISAGNNNQLVFDGSAKGGKGQLKISGSADPFKQTGNITIKGKDFRVAKSSQYFVELSPDMNVIIDKTLKVRGELGVPTAIISPGGGTGKSKVYASEDVVDPRDKKDKKVTNNSPLDVAITVKLGKNVRVNAQDIKMGLGGEMNINMRPNQAPKGSGTITTDTGRYRFYGQELDIKRGRVIFAGELTNPSLDINAEREIEDEADVIVAGVNILGTARRPELSLYSRPGLSDADILSYLAFGRRANSENFAQGVALQAAGAAGTSAISGGVRDATGLDVFDLTLSGLEVGKNLSKKAYVGYKRNFFSGINELIGKYHIKSCLKAEAKYSTGTDTGFDFICTFETD